MSGKFSRSKGRREEQQLVLYLATKGFKAERILRQYQTSGQPDVIATKADEKYAFEMKSRNSSFKTIYQLFDEEKNELGILLLQQQLPENKSPGRLVAISRDVIQLINLPLDSYFWSIGVSDKKKVRALNRIFSLQKLKQDADFLVIRDNNKPRLFIKYWL